jgi:hypothetical protein
VTKLERLIATIVLVIALAAPAIAADEPLKVGDEAVVFLNMTPACPDWSVMDRSWGVDPAAGPHRPCLTLNRGDHVTVEDASPFHREHLVCVRPHETAVAEAARGGNCYWVQRGQLMRPAEWLEHKARVDATVAFANDDYAHEHPECKDWRTNKNLPKRCY